VSVQLTHRIPLVQLHLSQLRYAQYWRLNIHMCKDVLEV